MGRTAKYKKIKACDPFSRKNGGKLDLETVGIWGYSDNGAKTRKRSKTAEKLRQQKINRKLKRMKDPRSRAKFQNALNGNCGLNRPPSDIEDEFSLQDIQGSVKPQTYSASIPLETKSFPTVKPSAGDSKNSNKVGGFDEKEIREATKLLGNSSSKMAKGRQENESKKAYSRRVKDETRMIIKQTKLKELNPEKRERKKEFLKKKKKRKRSVPSEGHDDDYNQDFARPVDEVPFGHQVERPPMFKTLPKGKKTKKEPKKVLKRGRYVDTDQKAMESLRQKLQDQYALIKQQRKRAGDFHL